MITELSTAIFEVVGPSIIRHIVSSSEGLAANWLFGRFREDLCLGDY